MARRSYSDERRMLTPSFREAVFPRYQLRYKGRFYHALSLAVSVPDLMHLLGNTSDKDTDRREAILRKMLATTGLFEIVVEQILKGTPRESDIWTDAAWKAIRLVQTRMQKHVITEFLRHHRAPEYLQKAAQKAPV